MTILPLCPQKQPIRDVDRADHPSSILIISVSCSLTDTIDARRFPSSELHGMRIVCRGYAATHIIHRVDSRRTHTFLEIDRLSGFGGFCALEKTDYAVRLPRASQSW